MANFSKPRKAYVTFYAGNGDKLMGVLGLAKGLKEVVWKTAMYIRSNFKQQSLEIERENISINRRILKRTFWNFIQWIKLYKLHFINYREIDFPFYIIYTWMNKANTNRNNWMNELATNN